MPFIRLTADITAVADCSSGTADKRVLIESVQEERRSAVADILQNNGSPFVDMESYICIIDASLSCGADMDAIAPHFPK